MNDTVIIKGLDSSDDLLSQSSKHYSEMEEVNSPKGSCNQEEGSPKVTSLMCSNCKTTKTPLWRRAPDGTIMCNACGLYLKTRSSLRPSWLKKPENLENPNNDCEGTCQGSGQCNGTGGSSSCGGCPVYNQSHQAKRETVCSNCGSTTTPLWRRDEEGKTICNACGLYYKLHKVHRPVSLKKSVIKRRKRLLVGNKRINTFPSTEAPSAATSTTANVNANTQPTQVSVSVNKSAAEQSTLPTKPNNRPNQPIFKVKRNTNPVVLSKPLTVEVPAIEDYLGPKKKTAESLMGSDKKSAAKRTIEEDTDVHYSPIKITARKAPAPVSYPPIQTQYKSVSPPSANNAARSSYRPPAQSPQPSYIHHSPHNHHHEPTSPSFSSTSLPPMVNSGFSSSSSSSSLSYHSPQTTQPNQRLTLPSIREVYPQFPQHTQVTQPPNLISSPIVDNQKNADSLDRDALAAHKRDLQIQMANLSQMLQSTSALLSGIDKALSSDR